MHDFLNFQDSFRLKCPYSFFYFCHLKNLQFFHGFVFVTYKTVHLFTNLTPPIVGLLFKYVIKHPICFDMCVFFSNTGIFLENRPGIHCLKSCLFWTLHCEALCSQFKQFCYTSVMLLQQGGRRLYPATMTSFTAIERLLQIERDRISVVHSMWK
jgi:hypothetical protein